MNITVGKNAGFCGGVNRSVIETYEDLKDIWLVLLLLKRVLMMY